VRSDTREQPKPQETLDAVTVRLLPEPGGIVLFSGSQLHETVENTTGVARYSIDFRTVNVDDVIARRGAPNIDARSTGTTMRDYLHATDLAHLPEDVVKMYDDGTEVQYQTLYFGDRLARRPAGGSVDA
jgi:ectoine hydroxylase-related dioxygenase (phytanoyl-CoA dioxygenase family)